jgi:cold shock CspA family protein
MPASAAVEDYIRKRAAKLDQFYDKIMACRVVVETPHRQHHKGKSHHIRIDLTVPSGELVIRREATRLVQRPARLQGTPSKELVTSREPSKRGAREDIYVAIRDAFDAARRKLQDYRRRREGAVKLHAVSPRGRVAELFTEEGYGFIEAADGREIYFHKNSVLSDGFEKLAVGREVYFTEERGLKGPQASTVRLAGKRRPLVRGGL